MHGNHARLRAAFHRYLNEGKNLSVSFVGGSITWVSSGPRSLYVTFFLSICVSTGTAGYQQGCCGSGRGRVTTTQWLALSECRMRGWGSTVGSRPRAAAFLLSTAIVPPRESSLGQVDSPPLNPVTPAARPVTLSFLGRCCPMANEMMTCAGRGRHPCGRGHEPSGVSAWAASLSWGC